MSQPALIAHTAMTVFPEYQRKAQAEIHSVIRPEGRLPDFRDRESLVYVEAILREVQMWQPVTLVAPHYIHDEDEYRGYRIPKESIVMGNILSVCIQVFTSRKRRFTGDLREILHNEEMYPDPYTFNPERWIKDGKTNSAIRDVTSAFGFGRR